MEQLFRAEAVEHRQQKLYGEVTLEVPASRWPVLVVVLLGSALLLALLTLGSYARRETVSGWLQPGEGLIRVESPSEGLLETLHVREGEAVAAGTPLATVSLDRQLGSGQRLSEGLQQQLDGESRLIDRQREALRQRDQQRVQALRDEAQDLERELAHYRRQLQTLEQRVQLAQRQQQEQSDLLRQGYLTRRDAEQLEDRILSLQANRDTVRQDMLERETKLRSTRHALATVTAEGEAALAELKSRQAGVQQRALEASGRGRLVLTAPRAGRVGSLRQAEGTALKAGALVADLLPANAVLQAELLVPSRAVASLQPGQAVSLRYDAYPYQHFGRARGQVIAIAQAPADPRELPLGLRAQEPVFRVSIGLDQQQPLMNGAPRPLRAGMTLQADLLLERRSLLAYLFAPLMGINPGR